MRTKVNRRTVDLTGFPDLVVIYLGMRVNAITGLKTVMGFGPKIARSVDARPEGLLLHENLIFSLFPPHVGMRQVLAQFRSARGLGKIRTASHVVAAVSPELGWYRLLA